MHIIQPKTSLVWDLLFSEFKDVLSGGDLKKLGYTAAMFQQAGYSATQLRSGDNPGSLGTQLKRYMKRGFPSER
jgi:hypothetical protein